MTKIDFKKLPYYKAKHGVFELIDIPKMQYLMIDGEGDPNTSANFALAIETLYPLAYKLKFYSKKQLGNDYVMPPLEGLWWADDMEMFTSRRDKSQWKWTLMLMVPEWITEEIFHEVRAIVISENVGTVRLEHLNEGLCVQTLHVGSYDDEGPTLKAMHQEFIPSRRLQISHKHHEIYLSDFRKVPLERCKTILRQPVIKI